MRLLLFYFAPSSGRSAELALSTFTADVCSSVPVAHSAPTSHVPCGDVCTSVELLFETVLRTHCASLLSG